jgi:hypothetical protein
MPITKPRRRNNGRLLHPTETVVPGLTHDNRASPKTRAKTIKQRLIVSLKAATDLDSAHDKLFEHKIRFEEV